MPVLASICRHFVPNVRKKVSHLASKMQRKVLQFEGLGTWGG
jgi:hypothetical protein